MVALGAFRYAAEMTKMRKIAKSSKPSEFRPIKSDLTGYAALLGESFSARVDLLERVIQGSHYPSLGRYKERILAKLIREYIPRNFDVGTGFVLFPHKDSDPACGAEYHDPLNKSAFAVSRQCDILVFDCTSVPPVFRDEDFVVVRPESVRAVIEVKGALNLPETDSLLESFVDFGRKWRATQLFYKSHHQGLTPSPALVGMAWKIQARSDGRPVTTPARVRDRIAEYYKANVSRNEFPGFPILSRLFVHNESDICRTTWADEINGRDRIRDGWASTEMGDSSALVQMGCHTATKIARLPPCSQYFILPQAMNRSIASSHTRTRQDTTIWFGDVKLQMQQF